MNGQEGEFDKGFTHPTTLYYYYLLREKRISISWLADNFYFFFILRLFGECLKNKNKKSFCLQFLFTEHTEERFHLDIGWK